MIQTKTTDQLVIKTDTDETASSGSDETSDDENLPSTSNKEVKDEFKNGVEFPNEERRKLKRTLPKKLSKKEMKLKVKKNIESDKAGYIKPDYAADRETERRLLHIATKGVTKLFNAVADRQKFVEQKLAEMEKGTKVKRREALEKLKSSDLSEQLQKYSRINPHAKPSKDLLTPKLEDDVKMEEDIKEELESD